MIQVGDLATIKSTVQPTQYGKVLYVLKGSHNRCITGLYYWRVDFNGKCHTVREDQLILIQRGEQ